MVFVLCVFVGVIGYFLIRLVLNMSNTTSSKKVMDMVKDLSDFEGKTANVDLDLKINKDYDGYMK